MRFALALISLLFLFLTSIKFSSSVVDDNVNGGNIVWQNPTNAQAEDGAFSTATVLTVDDLTDYLRATNFGFTIPVGSTINFVRDSVKCKEVIGAGDPLLLSDFSYKNGYGGSFPTSALTSPTLQWLQFNDQNTDTWNVSELNAVTSGFAITLLSGNTNLPDIFSVDAFKRTVDYTPPTGGKPKRIINFSHSIIYAKAQ